MRFDDESLGTFDPLDVPDCQLWLDAQDESTINPASPSHGEAITVWRDKSGNSNDADVVAAGTPIYADNGHRLIGGFPVIDLTNTDARLETTKDFVGGNFASRGYTAIGIARQPWSPRARVFSSRISNWLLGWWSNNNEKFYSEGWVANLSDGLISRSFPDIPCGTVRASTLYSDFAWNAHVSQHNVTGATSSQPRVMAFGGSGTHGEHSNCVVGEFLLYDRPLEYSERWNLFEYIRRKWNPFSRNYGGNAELRGYRYSSGLNDKRGLSLVNVNNMPFIRAIQLNGGPDYQKITDSSSGGNDGTLSANATGETSVPVLQSLGLDFNGSTHYVDIPAPVDESLNPVNITVSAWIVPDDISSYHTIVSKPYHTGAGWSAPYVGYLMRIDVNKVIFGGAANGTWSYVQTLSSLSPQNLYHIVGTYDGSAFRIYINGVLDNTNSSPSGDLLYGGNNENLCFGVRRPTSLSEWYNGAIHDVRIFGSALDQTNIDALFNGGAGRSTALGGELGWWKLDDNIGHSVEIPYSSQIGTDLFPTSELTAEAWVKLNSLPGDGERYAIISNYQTGGYGYFLEVLNSSGVYYARVGIRVGAEWQYASGDISSVINTTDWFHIAGTFDGSTRRIFLNGSLVGESNYSGSIAYNGYYSMHIGKYVNNGGSGEGLYFDGLIAEVGISDRAKPVHELYNIYIAGADPQYPFEVEADSNIVMNFDNDEGIIIRDEVPFSGSYPSIAIAHYKLNDNAANTTIVDSTGNSNGTLNGGNNTADLSIAGKINSTLLLDGVSDYVDTGLVWPGGKQGAISLWLKRDNSGTDDVCVGSMHSGGGRFYVGVNPSGYIGTGIGSNTFLTHHSGITATTGVWFHVVVTFDGSTVEIYVDGNLKHSGSQSGEPNTVQPAYIGTINNTGTPSSTYFFNGSVDDLRFFSRKLSYMEVQALYASGDGTEVASPFTAGNHDGIATGNIYPVVNYGIGDSSGRARTWYVGSTTSDYIEIPNHVDFNNAEQEMTIEMWVNPVSIKRMRLLQKQETTGTTPVPVPMIECYNTSGQLRVFGPRDTSARAVDIIVDLGNFKFVIGEWAYIAATFDPIAKQLIAFANGSPVGHDTNTNIALDLCSNNDAMRIGQNSLYAYPLDAYVGGFRYTTRKKTPLEIYNYYHGASLRAY